MRRTRAGNAASPPGGGLQIGIAPRRAARRMGPMAVATVGSLAALALLYSAPAGKAQQDSSSNGSLDGLEEVFAPGVFLEDRNGDGIVDFINARIVLPAGAVPEEVAAAANIAARLGFESSAFTPGLAVRDSDLTPGADTPPLFLVGRSNRWVRQLEEEGRVDLGELTPGQGLFAIVSSPFGGRDGVVVAGADPEGTLVAANAASARLPYLWQLRSDTIGSVTDDVESFLGESRVDVNGVRSTEAVYEKGREQVTRLVMTLDVVDPGNAAEVLDELAADHRVGQARFTDRRAVRLSYYGAGALDFQLPDGNGVVVDRFGPPYKSRFPGKSLEAEGRAAESDPALHDRRASRRLARGRQDSGRIGDRAHHRLRGGLRSGRGGSRGPHRGSRRPA